MFLSQILQMMNGYWNLKIWKKIQHPSFRYYRKKREASKVYVINSTKVMYYIPNCVHI